jgi:hypothetical protein
MWKQTLRGQGELLIVVYESNLNGSYDYTDKCLVLILLF